MNLVGGVELPYLALGNWAQQPIFVAAYVLRVDRAPGVDCLVEDLDETCHALCQ